MTTCTEVAVFRVMKENLNKAIELSEAIFAEMNAEEKAVLSHQILQNTNNAQELCWHLTFANSQVAKKITAKWPQLPSTKEFQNIVGQNIYFGHFVQT